MAMPMPSPVCVESMAAPTQNDENLAPTPTQSPFGWQNGTPLASAALAANSMLWSAGAFAATPVPGPALRRPLAEVQTPVKTSLQGAHGVQRLCYVIEEKNTFVHYRSPLPKTAAGSREPPNSVPRNFKPAALRGGASGCALELFAAEDAGEVEAGPVPHGARTPSTPGSATPRRLWLHVWEPPRIAAAATDGGPANVEDHVPIVPRVLDFSDLLFPPTESRLLRIADHLDLQRNSATD